MQKLVVKEINEEQVKFLETLLPQNADRINTDNFVIQTPTHRFFYKSQIVAPPNKNVYKVEVSGPHGDKITNYLKDKNLFYRGQPFNPSLNWYVFEEVEAQQVTFHIVDLTSGNVAYYRHADINFIGWRNDTSELVFCDISRLNINSWYAYDVRNNKSRCLFVGGEIAYLTADGNYLVVIASPEVFVALVEMESGKVISRILKKTFANFVEEPLLITANSFDSKNATLYVRLSGKQTSSEKAFAITLEVVDATDEDN